VESATRPGRDVRTDDRHPTHSPEDDRRGDRGHNCPGDGKRLWFVGASVYIAGDSGKMYYSFENGEEGSWDDVTPGSGSNVNAVGFFGGREGHIVDGNKTVFETDDGSTWGKIGIEDANENFYGVDPDGPADVWVCGGGGMIHHWNGSEWTPADTGDAALRDIEVEGGDGWTVGGGGEVYRYDGTWTQTETPTGQNLNAVVRGDPGIAVGAGGTIIER